MIDARAGLKIMLPVPPCLPFPDDVPTCRLPVIPGSDLLIRGFPWRLEVEELSPEEAQQGTSPLQSPSMSLLLHKPSHYVDRARQAWAQVGNS